MDDPVPAAASPESENRRQPIRSVSGHPETASQLRWILRWTFLALGAVFLSAVAAFAAASLQPPYYGARSEIALYAADMAELPEQYLTTQTLVVRSQAVLSPVAKAFKVPTDDLAEGLSVDFPEGGALMRIQYVDRDRTIALQRLSTIVSGYVAQLEQLERRQRVSHEVLVPPFIMADPVRPRPLQAAAIGGAAGLALIIMAFVLVSAREIRGGQA